MRYEFSAPPETCACKTCAACLCSIHSCCRPVPCKDNGRFHGCNCQAQHAHAGETS